MYKSRYLYLAIPILITFLLYLPGLDGPFLLDDYSNGVNSYSYGFNWAEILSATFSNQSGILRRPLANFSFVLNAMADPSAWGYKLVNLILHLVSGVLLFFLFHRLCRIRSDLSATRANLAAALVTALWLLHPLQVSTVLYVVQRMSILSALFLIAAILVYVRFRNRNKNNQPASALSHGIAYSLFWALALASKENAALLPLFVLLVEMFIFRFAVGSGPHDKRNLHMFLGLFVYLPLVLGIIYTTTYFDALIAGYAAREFTLAERLYTQIYAMIFYLKAIIAPVLSQMGIYHDDFSIQKSLDLVTLAYLLLLSVSVFLATLYRRRFPLATMGVLWFFTAHMLESTFLPLELVFEHRNYLAIAGFSMIMAEIIVHLPRSKITNTRHKTIWVGISLFLAVIATLTHLRVDSWSNREKLFLVQERNHPDSYRVLMEMVNIDVPKQRFSQAYSRIDRIEELTQDLARPNVMRLIVNCYENRDSAENLRKAAQLHANNPAWFKSNSELINLGKLSLSGRCPAYSDEQIVSLLSGIVRNKTGRHASRLYSITGQLYAKSSNSSAAILHYGLAYHTDRSQLEPMVAKTYLELNTGSLDDAENTILLLKKADKDTIVYFGHLIRELEQHLANARQRDKAN